MRILVLPLSLATAACAGLYTPPPPAVPTPAFSAQRFFGGRTQGDGMLKIALSKPRHVIVDGRGRIESDGTLVLDQAVSQEKAAPEHRQWRIHETSVGHYAGTLSDATGPVSGDVTGNQLHLRFTMKHGLIADQWLELAADGQSAQNRMTFSKFGLVVARLNETIRRVHQTGG